MPTNRNLMQTQQDDEPQDEGFNPKKNCCGYQDCIFEQSYRLEGILHVKKKEVLLTQKASDELKYRLKISSGGKKDRDEVKRSNFKAAVHHPHNNSNKQSFNLQAKEMIVPCDCGIRYHRICIREKLVKGQLKKCPVCQMPYSVGYTDCYALFNKQRPSYLKYMLV